MTSISITGKMHPGFENILNEEAQDFILKLHHKFSAKRNLLLEKRKEIHSKILSGEMPVFLKETESIRTEDWQDDVAARLHTGLPLYMRVSAATCRPAL